MIYGHGLQIYFYKIDTDTLEYFLEKKYNNNILLNTIDNLSNFNNKTISTTLLDPIKTFSFLNNKKCIYTIDNTPYNFIDQILGMELPIFDNVELYMYDLYFFRGFINTQPENIYINHNLNKSSIYYCIMPVDIIPSLTKNLFTLSICIDHLDEPDTFKYRFIGQASKTFTQYTLTSVNFQNLDKLFYRYIGVISAIAFEDSIPNVKKIYSSIV